LPAKVERLYIAIEEDTSPWSPLMQVFFFPAIWFVYLENLLRRLDVFNGLERFEVEWGVTTYPGPLQAHQDPPFQQMVGTEKVRKYGYIVGKKEEGKWTVRFWDDDRGGMLRWHTMHVDGIQPANTWVSNSLDVARLAPFAVEPF
jgi:hypothetical protein